MDKLKLSDVGGFPLVLDDLQFLLGRLGSPDEGIYPAFNNLLRGFGDNFIVQGCVLGGVSGAFTLTEGWIMLDGELIKVDVQLAFDEATDNKFVKATTFDPRGEKTFLNGSINQTYENNRASITGTSGNLDFDAKTFFQLKNQADFRDDTPSEQPLVTLKKKVIEIGAWNMQSTVSVTIAHGISSLDITKARITEVMIDDPSGSVVRPLGGIDTVFNADSISGGVNFISSASIKISRATGSIFDNPGFSSTGINRGWITIEYEA